MTGTDQTMTTQARPHKGDVLPFGMEVISHDIGYARATYVLDRVPAVLTDRAMADAVGFCWQDFDFNVTRHQLLGSDQMTATVVIIRD